MSKALAIFSNNPYAYAPHRLAEEARKKGFSAAIFDYQEVDLYFASKGERKIFLKEKKITEPFWGAIFRSSRNPHHIFTLQRDCLLNFFLQQKTIVLNQIIYQKWPVLDKITEHFVLSQNKLPIATSWVFGSSSRLKEKIKLPAVLKFYLGSHGSRVFKIESFCKLEKTLACFPAENLLVQEILPEGEDLRVIVLGGKAMGAMRKRAAPGKFVTNYSAGGSVSSYNLKNDYQAKILAEKAAKIFKADFCGVDLMKDAQGEWRVLEVNTDCQFEGFEKATGINVAQKVIEFLIKQKIKYGKMKVW